MVKHYCDICGKLLNPAPFIKDDDPDDYTYGEITVDLGVWFKIDDVCKACANKFNKITKDEVMIFIRWECCVESDNN